jgi:hypothetical protein
MLALINPIVRLLLRSPFHGLLSDTLMLLTVTGRSSGTHYIFPVAYGQQGEALIVLTSHAWWKNLRGGAPVQVEIKRVRRMGRAEAISEDRAAIAAELLAQMRAHPALAKSFHIPLDTRGQPDADAVQAVAQHEVLVRIALLPSTAAWSNSSTGAAHT